MRQLQTVKDSVTVLKKPNGQLTSDNQQAADVLANYYGEMFTREDTAGISYQDEIEQSAWEDTDVYLSTDAVLQKLRNLKDDKSPGPDSIHPMLLKSCAGAVAEPLSCIFKASFESGVIPQDWKTASVVPIFKKGSRTDAANYRPVSLTSIPCKIMESLIKASMSSFLEENKTITDRQHGFMKNRSCLTNLLECFENWTQALDEGFEVDVVYLDYRKAFDSVPILRLIEKLKTYGLKGKVL